ncbi:transcript variant X1 [Nothobranchius furzeri]|uniref:Metalloendopeptidase n=1 Tax=Nothobranchius furzeri TaxID=105023 RepID=A0A9D2Y9Y2_NOTFU|nr:transcript variant X1 [Nothobranchius furzeri]
MQLWLFVALVLAEIVKNGENDNMIPSELRSGVTSLVVERDVMLLKRPNQTDLNFPHPCEEVTPYRKKRNAVGIPWPTKNIPYEISSEMENQMPDILAAMEMISNHTCISFHERKPDEPNYLFYKVSESCTTYIGFTGGQQAVLIGPQCSMGNIAHEILHSLGFHHEHTRWDRDNFISVVEANIIAGMEYDFEKNNGETFNIPYDYTSIMHYGRNVFSSNGKDTIIPKQEAKNMGQRRQLMQSDIDRVQKFYHCDSEEAKTKTES